jgi:transposase
LERSARLIDQLSLAFEELEARATEDELAAETAVAKTTTVAGFTRKRPERNTFPDHLPRERVVIEPAGGVIMHLHAQTAVFENCRRSASKNAAYEFCGGNRLRKLGEDRVFLRAKPPRLADREYADQVDSSSFQLPGQHLLS